MRVSVTNRRWRGGNKNGGSRLSADLYWCQAALGQVTPGCAASVHDLEKSMNKNASGAYV